MEEKNVDLKPLFNWSAVATGIAIIDDITNIPIILIDREIVAPTSNAKI